ncbi:hypothetical protein GCM10009779_57510 [Polymorphospora rubra]|uniref:Uncharacterized protein n=1 Tax=Polymorphospora rubra TaxID=338584 RepID=A0A810N4V1_9ACTN|nr:hypothetical protein Prubr_49910 [Polymorphospora rubra]
MVGLSAVSVRWVLGLALAAVRALRQPGPVPKVELLRFGTVVLANTEAAGAEGAGRRWFRGRS